MRPYQNAPKPSRPIEIKACLCQTIDTAKTKDGRTMCALCKTPYRAHKRKYTEAPQ